MSAVLLRIASGDDAERLGALHVASWHETYKGIVPDEMLASLSVEDRTAFWSKILGNTSGCADTFVWVAEEVGRIVGFGSCGRQRDQSLSAKGFDAEISAIYILRSHQGSGIGRAIMNVMASTLCEREHRAATLWVLRENGAARGFYERLGGILVAEKEDVRRHATLIEVAYGWRNLASLITSTA
jgi:ribosomal protein S18 acetylase RimI-like enzyme